METAADITNFERAFRGFSAALPAGERSGREEAFARFAAKGLPTTASEAWRYTSLKPFSRLAVVVPAKGAEPLPAVVGRIAPEGSARLVFTDGWFRPEFSSPADVLKGLRITPLAEPAREKEGTGTDLAGLLPLNAALTTGGFRIEVPAATAFGALALVHVYHGTASGPCPFACPRHEVFLEEGSGLSLREIHATVNSSPHAVNAFTRIRLGVGARLNYTRLSLEGGASRIIVTAEISQERDSDCKAFDFSFGGALSRRNLVVTLAGEGASAGLSGLYAVQPGRQADTHVDVTHAAPGTLSRQVYKGIIAEAGRGIFNGRIVVCRGAARSDAAQIVRNLLLGAKAEADAKPELEILNDDVRVNHGATVGELDPEEIFYLMSRAIPPGEAKDMLVRGFVAEVLDAAPDAAPADFIKALLAEEFFA